MNPKQQCTPSGAQLPFLPTPAVINMLTYVPQRQRLYSCACVCQQWAAAAIAATIDIKRTVYDYDEINQLQDWLQAHSSQVESMDMSAEAEYDNRMCL